MSAGPTLALPAGASPWAARRWSGSWSPPGDEALAEEAAVALVFNGIAHIVMMATPTDLEDFALGFTLTEGLLDSPSELYGIEVVPTDAGLELQLEVSAACERRLKERRRTLAGRSGCGLCGAESLTQVRRSLAPVAPVQVQAEAVVRAEAELAARQQLQQVTGATHAAAWVNLQGQLLHLREDVGRHNALDKLVGTLVRQGVAVTQGFVLVTSRASFEMVQKSVALGAGLLAAVSAPTSLAVDCAREANLCVLGFVRPGKFTAYTFGERLL